jgi:uncharacterized integral membrane protein
LIQILQGRKRLPLWQAGVLVRMNLAGRPLFYLVRSLKLIAASILVILVAIIFAQNREPPATHLLVATVVMPCAILLFIGAVAGFTLGTLLTLSLSTKRDQIF